ncbi:hypothetical protein GCM10017764_02810 [Sphingobacterium griseoflavum]|uniref:Tetratricopeptide repeat protein n=2 Tax=Sphingobacterium griseoflavum TaxID=1474952 RepID=A0ABQ3HPZ6_9SPHI|nr:hypothetical protein GCM10017764_02810 [Sphingobacterium griseoflavum]
MFHTVDTYKALIQWRESVIYSNIQRLEVLKKLRPTLRTNGYYLYSLGYSHLENNNYDCAIVNFKKAKLLYPDKDVILNLASALVKVNELQLAEMEYKNLIKAFPNDINLYAYLADFYRDFHRFDSLKNLQKRVENLIPKNDFVIFEKKKREILAL